MVLDGEVSLELDTGEVLLEPGDCIVQRGTRHAWRNRSDKPVKMMARTAGAMVVAALPRHSSPLTSLGAMPAKSRNSRSRPLHADCSAR